MRTVNRHDVIRIWSLAVALVLCPFAFRASAIACEGPPIPPSPSFSIDTGLEDNEPPGSVDVTDWRVERDADDDGTANACDSGCSPGASIGFKVVPPDDTAGDILGYIVRITEPSMSGCDPCGIPISAEERWIWVTSEYAYGDDIRKSFEVLAVDRAGNEGPATSVDVFDPNSGGCSSRPGGTFSVLGLLALALLFLKITRKSKIPT